MTIRIAGDAPERLVAPGGRHPAGLPTLFFTEMWERFSYYGMRALLVLYLVNALGYARSNALAVYGTYTALVYLTPIAGGYLADRYLGYRKAILIGALVMAMGHFAMAFPALLLPALGLIIVGNGFFKPNISTLLGTLYREHDPRRDGGFTIFYIGINLGAFIAPLIAGTLGEEIGWHWGFASAGVGMLLANKASKIVNGIVKRAAPVVQDLNGFLKVLNPKLQASDHCLVLLYQRGEDGATEQELSQWVRPKMRANLRRTLGDLVHKKDLAHFDGSRYLITRAGEQYVEQKNLITAAQLIK